MNPAAHTTPLQQVMGKGRIEVIFGPMFSGKTTELIRRITRFQFAKFRCIVIKYAGDVRYSEADVATHDSRTLPAVSAAVLSEHLATAMSYDVVGIDEGQFFPDLIPFTEDLANAGKTIVVAALDGTFERTGFGAVLQLVPLAESVIKLSAVCMVCCGDASFTQRISGDKGLEIIGGADKYRAVCRDCYRGLPKPSQRNRTPIKPDDGVPPVSQPPQEKSLVSAVKRALLQDGGALTGDENGVTPPKKTSSNEIASPITVSQ